MKKWMLKAKGVKSPEELKKDSKRLLESFNRSLGIISPGDYELIEVKTEWIKAKTRPPEYTDILFQDAAGIMYLGFMDHLNRFIAKAEGHIDGVIVWMPAPDRY